MYLRQAVLAALLFFAATMRGLSQSSLPEIPSRFKAVIPHQNLSSARTITLAVKSRCSENPDTPENMGRLRKRP